MKIDNNGVNLVAQFEGLKLKPYYATSEEKAKGIVTIGFGSTFYPNGAKVKITDNEITKEKALELLKSTLDSFALKVDELVKTEVNQNQFNALLSLAYNIGLGAFKVSTVLRLVNQNPNNPDISKWFLARNKQAGKELQGLTNRRKKEVEVYFK